MGGGGGGLYLRFGTLYCRKMKFRTYLYLTLISEIIYVVTVKWWCPLIFYDVTYHIWLEKYCRSSQRAQQDIQEQPSNTKEQDTSNSELKRVLQEYYKMIY